MVNAEDKVELETILKSFNIEYKIVIENVANAIKTQHDFESHKKIENLKDFDYSKFHTLDEIYDWIDQLATQYPNYISVFNISRSYENRYLKAFKISVPSATPKKAMWFDGGIHAYFNYFCFNLKINDNLIFNSF
jgi:hypothetical protein